ncbi:MAG: hypothetical protein H0V82_06610 [Candidatus Protochlamydia sp.]|nr:hypothetical protein [Candidatus Protochlamydia sp.]
MNIQNCRLEMRYAICDGDEDKIKNLLMKGFNPNSNISCFCQYDRYTDSYQDPMTGRSIIPLVYALGLASLPIPYKNTISILKAKKIVQILHFHGSQMHFSPRQVEDFMIDITYMNQDVLKGNRNEIILELNKKNLINFESLIIKMQEMLDSLYEPPFLFFGLPDK